MAQKMNSADPDFVKSLKSNISGIYFTQVARYTPDTIESEFRKAVQDPALVADDEFMRNLMFLVRKREVRALHDDVWKIVAAGRLKPQAQVSALKTFFAIGSETDRAAVDSMEAEALAGIIRSGSPPESSPYVEFAERIGGARSLVAVQRLQFDAANRQRGAEQQTPGNHALISQLDKVRARLARQMDVLARKQAILVKPEPDRTAELTRVYMRRHADLSCWAYRELVNPASPGDVEAVRRVVAREIPTFLPASGQGPEDRAKGELDLRLRGIALLHAMDAVLDDEQTQLLSDHFQMMQERQPFFYPACDWEDILDRV